MPLPRSMSFGRTTFRYGGAWPATESLCCRPSTTTRFLLRWSCAMPGCRRKVRPAPRCRSGSRSFPARWCCGWTRPRRPGRRDRARARGVGMIFPSSHVRVLVATRPVDFRKGHDGLAALVQSVLKEDPFTGTVFVFRPKRADRLKILFWDGTGLVMAYKRLEDTTFTWPAIQDGAMTLNHAQFEALFSGLDWRKVKALEVRRPAAAE